jgi:uncharacterized membrane protein YeiH
MEISSVPIKRFTTGVPTFGTLVFAASGAFAAGESKMEQIGFTLLGPVTAEDGAV